ncbi:hypothetical protein [Nostoc sp. MG11]|uniref:hypothetical protein n=1 Tax=Nostoc sp. MG11 TaxID=2721166 RepID=UPI001867F86C|nr:hypothetical protein [Nostoc sp. MG11]
MVNLKVEAIAANQVTKFAIITDASESAHDSSSNSRNIVGLTRGIVSQRTEY